MARKKKAQAVEPIIAASAALEIKPIVHQPVSVEPLELQPPPKPSYLPNGLAEVVQIDKDGNEVGLPFTTSIQTAEKHYNNSKFKIKKKA